MKIAIIGAGISGLTVAYHLHQRHDVTVYEANAWVGGHTDTHNINVKGETYAVDTGFIVFNFKNYPNFTKLLDELGVASQPSDMSFGISNRLTGLEYSGANLDKLFSQRRNMLSPRFLGMIRDILRFYREAIKLLDSDDDHTTLGEYLCQNGYGKAFVEDHLYPMACAIWSAPPGLISQFPVRYLVAFMNNHRLLHLKDRPKWRVIQGGSTQYVNKLTQGFAANILTQTPVRRIERDASSVFIYTDKAEKSRYDKVFLACHSDQALAMLAAPTDDEHSILSAIRYQENETILHSDIRFMPQNRKAWSSWNVLINDTHDMSRCNVTYHMNALQNLKAPTEFLVTLNPSEPIAPEKIWCTRTYHHPVYTPEAIAAQKRWHDINGVNNTFYCGAYWGWGFHEDGHSSALRALEQFHQETLRDAA